MALKSKLYKGIGRSLYRECIYHLYGIGVVVKAVVAVNDIPSVKDIEHRNAKLQAGLIAYFIYIGC
jgi:hypothetical protein